MHQAIPLHARVRANWSPIRQWPATGAKVFATATRTEIFSICWMIAHDSDPLSRLLRIWIAWLWPPTCRMDQNSTIRIQVDDIIDVVHTTFRSISLLHISSLFSFSDLPLLRCYSLIKVIVCLSLLSLNGSFISTIGGIPVRRI